MAIYEEEEKGNAKQNLQCIVNIKSHPSVEIFQLNRASEPCGGATGKVREASKCQ